MKVAVLHPGAMGITVAQALVANDHEVVWVRAGRSDATAERAKNLTALESLADLAQWAEVVISVCPPESALSLAEDVIAAGYKGLYVDANAVSPDTARDIQQCVGAQLVDGGIVGPPALQEGTTRLYLSGSRAAEVAVLFQGSVVDARVVGQEVGQASALKMAYAAYTKGSGALLLAVNALAEAAGVAEALYEEWDISQPNLPTRSQGTAAGTGPKAWRFVGEMEEIAATFESYDLPGDFHKGAAEIYQRMASLKGHEAPDLEAVLALLTQRRD